MKETFYFSHDYNAQSDEKILKLRRKMGMEGYGIYWALIEKLASNKGKMSLDGIDDIAYDLHIDNKVITDVIKCYNLFEINDKENYFFTQRLLDHFEHRESKKKIKSEAGKKGMAKRWGKDNSVITEKDGDITKHNKGKESKGKESKKNDSKLSLVEDFKISKLGKELYKEESLYIEKNGECYLSNELFIKTLLNFIKFRKEIKKPMTLRAIELLLMQGKDFDLDIYIKMIDQSIFNGWQGIFDLKATDTKNINQQGVDYTKV